MPEVSSLSHDEKVFLAGCFKTFILADGNIDELELEDLDKLYSKLDFQDYEECLNEFEEKVPDKETFYTLANNITNPESQSIILKAIYELSLHSGIPTKKEEGLFQKPNGIWEK